MPRATPRRSRPSIPALVLGPVLSRDFSDSVQAVQRLLSGRVPGLPRLGFSFVDVRDVADLHIRAMTAPEAAGQRFIAAGDFAWMADLAALLRARLGDAAGKVPTRRVPDLVIRLAALFDKSLAAVAPRLGEKRDVHLGEGAADARLAATFVGRDGPGLRQEPDRCRRGLKGRRGTCFADVNQSPRGKVCLRRSSWRRHRSGHHRDRVGH